MAVLFPFDYEIFLLHDICQELAEEIHMRKNLFPQQSGPLTGVEQTVCFDVNFDPKCDKYGGGDISFLPSVIFH